MGFSYDYSILIKELKTEIADGGLTPKSFIQVLREENIQKVNFLLKEKQELMQKIKDKEELIQSIENDTAKSLKAVEDEIAKLQEEKEKLENEKEEGQIGKH